MSTADLMQPGLVPLQPNLDDLMDYDPIQGRQLLLFVFRSLWYGSGLSWFPLEFVGLILSPLLYG